MSAALPEAIVATAADLPRAVAAALEARRSGGRDPRDDAGRQDPLLLDHLS